MIYRVHSVECVFAGTCEVALGVLKDNRLIIVEEEEKFSSTPYGRLVAKYSISVESMRILYQVNLNSIVGCIKEWPTTKHTAIRSLSRRNQRRRNRFVLMFR